MCHEFHIASLRQGRDSIQFLSLNALNQVEEIIRETISTSEPAIDKVPVGSVQPALFAGPEREVAPDFHIGGNQITHEQIRAQVHVMVSVNV